MKKNYAFVILLVILLSSCSLFHKESFEGNWEMKIEGGAEKTFQFLIKEDLSFTFSDVVTVQGSEYFLDVKGKVSEDGKIEAIIYSGTQEIGGFTGKLTNEYGEGSWSGGNLVGTWTAVKN